MASFSIDLKGALSLSANMFLSYNVPILKSSDSSVKERHKGLKSRPLGGLIILNFNDIAWSRCSVTGDGPLSHFCVAVTDSQDHLHDRVHAFGRDVLEGAVEGVAAGS